MLKQFCHAVHVCLAQHIVNISAILSEMIDFFSKYPYPEGKRKSG
ncbi:hypothetical protein NEIFLAOT_00492 [Neisseria flavescens NRL30031/H210]|uniref:Uncharacterized protein n=1 Tax=Neisseria flavescens NRL30031/H210 TaxID=546264 RepID=C0EKP4_NEIFL|nr:hypothetical protein NEIFLAOT_00492 [Neisseria flavescens NRL30031/H210]